MLMAGAASSRSYKRRVSEESDSGQNTMIGAAAAAARLRRPRRVSHNAVAPTHGPPSTPPPCRLLSGLTPRPVREADK